MQEIIPHLQIARHPAPGYSAFMELKIRIREIRKAKGLTLAQVAEKVGISTPHLSEVERGVKNLNNHLLVRIAGALKVEPDELIEGEPIPGLDRLRTIYPDLDPQDQERVLRFAQNLLQSQPK